MDLKLQNKIIVVSGSVKGIGEAIIKLLAGEGAIPVIIGSNETDNLETVDNVKKAGGKCFQVTAELINPQACENAIEYVMKKFGQIHGLINNEDFNEVIELEHGNYEAFVSSLHKKLIHYYLLTHYCLPALKKSKGAIVNISSKKAETAQHNTLPYATSNGGRNALTREWAVELLKYGIRVNAVIAECPTSLNEKWINTLHNPEKKLNEITAKISPENRMTTVEETANTVAFLLSEKSSHTTGQLIHVGGEYIHSRERW